MIFMIKIVILQVVDTSFAPSVSKPCPGGSLDPWISTDRRLGSWCSGRRTKSLPVSPVVETKHVVEPSTNLINMWSPSNTAADDLDFGPSLQDASPGSKLIANVVILAVNGFDLSLTWNCEWDSMSNWPFSPKRPVSFWSAWNCATKNCNRATQGCNEQSNRNTCETFSVVSCQLL